MRYEVPNRVGARMSLRVSSKRPVGPPVDATPCRRFCRHRRAVQNREKTVHLIQRKRRSPQSAWRGFGYG